MNKNEPLSFLKLTKFEISNNTDNPDKFYNGIISKQYKTTKFYPTGHFRSISKSIDYSLFLNQLRNHE